MLSGAGAAAPAAPSITIQAPVIANSITAIVAPAQTESTALAGPGLVFIVPAPIPAVVVHLGSSSAPATNHLHLGIALSEERPTTFTHFGNGSDNSLRRADPRPEDVRSAVDVSLIDVVEPYAPQAPAPQPPKPEAAPATAPETPAAVLAPAPPAVLDALFDLPTEASRAPLASSDNADGRDDLVESIPSMGVPSWLGLAATAVGGCRFVWTDKDRAQSPWSTPTGRRRSLKARS